MICPNRPAVTLYVGIWRVFQEIGAFPAFFDGCCLNNMQFGIHLPSLLPVLQPVSTDCLDKVLPSDW